MAKERTSTSMQSEIQMLLAKRMSIRKVARALGISRKTVRRYAESVDVSWDAAKPETWEKRVDWAKVKEDLTVRSVTVKQVHREMAPEGINYLTFGAKFGAGCRS